MAKATTTTHVTGVGEIMFMAAGRPLKDDNGNDQYSIKLKLSDSDPSISHLKGVSPKKIDTANNRANKAGDGYLFVNFSSSFAPDVADKGGVKLEGDDIPYFDSRVDTGTAAVSYKVVTYPDGKSIVRLAAIKLIDLNITDKESGTSGEEALDMLRNI